MKVAEMEIPSLKKVASEKLPPSAPPDGVERTTFALHYGRLRLHPIHVTAASRK